MRDLEPELPSLGFRQFLAQRNYIIMIHCSFRRRQWHPTPVLLPGKSHRCRKAAVHGVTEGQIRLSVFTFTFHFHALEKGMATHSSVLAWRIPGTGEPGRLPSMGSHSRTWLKWLSSSSIALLSLYLLSTLLAKKNLQHLLSRFSEWFPVNATLSQELKW